MYKLQIHLPAMQRRLPDGHCPPPWWAKDYSHVSDSEKKTEIIIFCFPFMWIKHSVFAFK